MKKLLSNLVVFFVLLVFLINAVGISFLVHRCNSAKTQEVLFFTDHLEKSQCCCTNENHNKGIQSEFESYIKRPKCCNLDFQYVKLSETYNQVTSEIISFSLLNSFFQIYSTNNFLNLNPFINEVFHFWPPPILLYGKSLVYFILSIKIPSPAFI